MAVGPLRSEYWREFPGRFSQDREQECNGSWRVTGGMQQIEYPTCVDVDRNIL